MRQPNCKWENCGKQFKTEEEIFYHVIEAHSSSGKSSCLWRNNHGRLCQVVFKHRSMLKDHAIAHFSIDIRPFKCEVCSAKFRSARCVREHKKASHSSNSSPTTIPYTMQTDFSKCNVGSSFLKYDMMLQILQPTDFIVPDSVTRILKNLKLNGGRIPPNVIYDTGFIDLKVKYLDSIKNNPATRRNNDLIVKKHVIENTRIDFNLINTTHPSNNAIPMKFQQRYRKLCIIISKNFFTLLQTFNNEYLGALVESEILSDTNQASRIGIRLLFHPLLHIGAITVRRQLIRILFELYQEICMEKFRNDFDSMHFSISQIPGDNGMVLWVTIGQEVFLNLAAAPLKHESFKLIGFSL